MNLKGILLVALLALSGADVGMSQIVAGEALPLTISGVPSKQEGIEAGTAIGIKIMGIPAEDKAKIDDVYPVSKKGVIKLPHIDGITAAGKTTEQLARDIEKAYTDAQIYAKPSVTIFNGHIDSDPHAKFIHIGGQVRKPGPIPFAKGMTLWMAIQKTGGKTEFGSLKRVRLYRDGNQTTYDMTIEENKSVLLKDNDTIEVPQLSGCADH